MVNAGHYGLAIVLSILIGVANLTLFKMVPNVHTWPEIASYLIGAPLGICCAVWCAERFKRKAA